MKAILFAALLLAAVCSGAQEVTIYRISSTNTYPGKNVPTYIVSSFEKSNPGMTVIAWEPVNTTWRATYHANNRVNHVYYNEMGHSYRSILPIIQNNVPETVITKAIDKHGSVVYGITALKGVNDTQIYQVRLMENGNTKTVWMDAEGNDVNYSYRKEEIKPAEPVL